MSTPSRTVNFRWPHHGRQVQLAGSFTSWSPVDMVKQDQLWTVQMKVSPGKHEYKFVVDETEWVHDDQQPCLKNEVGSYNNVIDVEMSPSIEVS